MKINVCNIPWVMLEGKTGDQEAYHYRAWPVRNLMIDLKAAEQLEFLSTDGEMVAVSTEEILNGEVYLAEEGSSFRLVITSDTHRRRWCKNIVEIKGG